ncbi:VWA domain-containing protein [Nocardiopsis alba]|uniref:vWA domain-containing protein n=1 Tax=Nocardiopsis alba TaxID=53437 RepID=UPI003D702ECA
MKGRTRAGAGALAVLLAVSACSFIEGAGAAGTLRVLAGSELADMEPLLAESAERTGVELVLDYSGTLDGTERVLAGGVEDYDAVWFPSNRYLHLADGDRSSVRDETSVMLSPVVLGVSASRAEGLGWVDGDGSVSGVTWEDVTLAVEEEGLTYGMSSPAASNSGFSALIGAASAMADSGAALEREDVAGVEGRLAAFFSGQELTAGSSGWLMEEFERRRRDVSGSGAVAPDGVVNYESVLLSYVPDSGEDPLVLVYPEDGVVTADYPLTLLADASDEAAAAYERVVADLTSAEVQARIAETTFRRPVAAGVSERGFPSVVELPFPARREVVDELVSAYFSELRRPARTVYVLDVSGSMSGSRISGLRRALTVLTGADEGPLSSRGQVFQEREEVTLLPFSDEPGEPVSFVVEPEGADSARRGLAEEIAALEVGGETAAYDAVEAAYSLLEEAGEDGYLSSVVLMTDGEVNRGLDLDGLLASLDGLPSHAAAAPVFTVLFGEADAEEMERLSSRTGGRVFDARDLDLEEVFREIRGYH